MRPNHQLHLLFFHFPHCFICVLKLHYHFSSSSYIYLVQTTRPLSLARFVRVQSFFRQPDYRSALVVSIGWGRSYRRTCQHSWRSPWSSSWVHFPRPVQLSSFLLLIIHWAVAAASVFYQNARCVAASKRSKGGATLLLLFASWTLLHVLLWQTSP